MGIWIQAVFLVPSCVLLTFVSGSTFVCLVLKRQRDLRRNQPRVLCLFSVNRKSFASVPLPVGLACIRRAEFWKETQRCILHFCAPKMERSGVGVRTVGIIGFCHLSLKWLELTGALFHSQDHTLQEYATETGACTVGSYAPACRNLQRIRMRPR